VTIRPILIYGDPVLHTRARDVTVFDTSLKKLIADMFETMDAAPGSGLAGPQIGVGQRLFVFNYTDDSQTTWRGVAVNPTLWLSPTSTVPLDEERESEGCLSFPGERFPLRRANSAILQAADEAGQPFEIHAEGWLARIFQHEFDHLDGIIYVDRLDHIYQKAAHRLARKRNWAAAGNSWLPGVDPFEGEE
jgi:peptide deformylase